MIDDEAIRKQTRQPTVVGNTLLRKLSFCTPEVKRELFRSHCYSVYCSSLWSCYRTASLNKVRVCHNDNLKRLLGLPRWTSSSLFLSGHGLKTLNGIHRHSAFRTWHRVEQSGSSIVTSIKRSCAYVCGPIHHEWMRLLFPSL